MAGSVEGMRVVLVTHNSEAGGAVRAMLELIDGLRERGVACSVLLRERGWLVEELNRRNIPFAIIPYRWWSSPRRWWRNRLLNLLALMMVIPVRSQLKRWEADVVLTNTSVIGVGALAAYFLRKPHIWYIHEFGKEDHGLIYDLGIRLSSRLMARLSALVIVNSKAVEAYYARFIPQRQIRVVYCGIEDQGEPATDPILDTKALRASRAAQLVLVGTLQEGKGQTDAVRALGQLISQGVQVELTLVGPDAPGDPGRVQRLVSSRGLEKLVKFTGQVSDPSPIVKGSDIALVCSRSEAFGRVTVEAMKLGKPVVGARSGATPELIRESFNGLLYTPGDYLELAQKIKYLIDNPEVARQMGDNGRRWAEAEFSLEKYAGKVFEALEEALRQRRV